MKVAQHEVLEMMQTEMSVPYKGLVGRCWAKMRLGF
jgi:hypothetical protein